MDVVTRRRNALHTLAALAGAIALLLSALPAEAGPPVDEIDFTGETCATGFPTAQVTATGKGKWGVMIVEVSTDGGQTYEVFSESLNPLRAEHGVSTTVAWAGDVIFRATDARNNGDAIGGYVLSQPISCP
ncbi:MAG TPA: hypothetical protein VFS66_09750 [Acidimicrobiia bacterium]|nr:hypothetical protein [Acidimicrobiia bacterium]